MNNTEHHDLVGSRAQREAARAAVTHTDPTADRYASAFERYIGAVAGEHADVHQAPTVTYPLMTVGDVMSSAVVNAYPGAAFKEIASALVRNRVEAVPVINQDRRVLGVVTVSDLLARIAPPLKRRRRMLAAMGSRRAARAVTARQLMTSPAITTTPSATLDDVARLMARRHVRTLPVVDRQGALVGMIARADVIRIFLRADEEILAEVETDVLCSFDANVRRAVRATVAEGVVTLAGQVPNALTAKALVHRVRQLTGVLDVRDELAFELDDSILPRRSQ